MSNLKELSGRITEIDQTIGRIASQAEVLALNSSIEAARAGKLGDEMKVIADEVSELARISVESAEQSTEIVNKLATGLQMPQPPMKRAETASARRALNRMKPKKPSMN